MSMCTQTIIFGDLGSGILLYYVSANKFRKKIFFDVTAKESLIFGTIRHYFILEGIIVNKQEKLNNFIL